MTIYFIEGKKVDLNSSEWDLIYSDGRWNSRGVNLYWRAKDDRFILEDWTNWQGEHNSIDVLERDEAISWLLSQSNHPNRVMDALETINAEVEAF